MAKQAMRTERDSMGPMQVPAKVLYGASTARAVANFPISGRPIPAPVIHALGAIKAEAAAANMSLGLVQKKLGRAIVRAANEVARGDHDAEFPVDIYQTGSGTSSNMNANEVIANRASQLLGGALGSKLVHPNDHVNYGQSSNDVFPTAVHLAVLGSVMNDLVPACELLLTSLQRQSKAFHGVIKSGRTHLQDATPIRLGQEFSGYAHQIKLTIERVRGVTARLGELPLGGTAVGTGVNTHPQFAKTAIARLKARLNLPVRETRNHFQAQAAPDTLVEVGGILKTLAVALIKMSNDLRWLGSGPRCGLGELQLPAVQPGSSIMPGKVNPVIIESLQQICARVIGNDTALTQCGVGGFFELNVMYPLFAEALCESISLLSAGARNFATQCVDGLEVNTKRCQELLEQNLSVGTVLAPVVGYDNAAKMIKTAFAEGATIREIALRESGLTPSHIAKLLDPRKHTKPGVPE